MIGNTTPDAIKFMRDLAVQADTDAGGNVYIGTAQQNSGYPFVVMSIPSKSFTPSQASGSEVDEIRVQVDTFAQRSRNGGDASAFETAHNIDYALRAAWSRQKSLTGDFDNAIDSIQEVGGFETDFPENGVYQVSSDYIVRVVGSGTTSIAPGITTQSNTIKRKKLVFTHNDLAYEASTQTYDLGFTLPAKGILRSITAQPTELFYGTFIDGYTIMIGTLSEPNKYLFEQDVFDGAPLPDAVLTGGTIESMTEDTVFKITATAIGGNLEQASQGSVSIWISYEVLN